MQKYKNIKDYWLKPEKTTYYQSQVEEYFRKTDLEPLPFRKPDLEPLPKQNLAENLTRDSEGILDEQTQSSNIIVQTGDLVVSGVKKLAGGVKRFFGWIFQKKEKKQSTSSKKSNQHPKVPPAKKGNVPPKVPKYLSGQALSDAMIEQVQEKNNKKKEKHLCTRIVMNVISGKKGDDVYVVKCGQNDPPEALKVLIARGYVKAKGNPKPGTIRIFDKVTGISRYGHIQVYCHDGVWRSDFIQKRGDVYGIQSAYIDYEMGTNEDQK